MDDIEILNSEMTRNEKFLMLLERHIGVMVKESKKFSTNIVCDEEDYLQQALLGMLTTAIKTYDNDKKTKFVTHLVNTIRGYIKEEYGKFYGPITISSEGASVLRNIKKLLDNDLQIDEIAEKLSMEKERVENCVRLIKSRSSESFDTITTDPINVNIVLMDAKLTDEELKVVELRRSHSLRDTASVLNKSHEWVRGKELSALKKVKNVI